MNFLTPRLWGVLGLSVGEDFVILSCVILTQGQRVGQTDGGTEKRTEGWTDNPTVGHRTYNTGLCIAIYADAL